jgi:hypothetical protein
MLKEVTYSEHCFMGLGLNFSYMSTLNREEEKAFAFEINMLQFLGR